MIHTLTILAPEITLFVASCVVMVLGLSPAPAIRRQCGFLTVAALLVAGALALNGPRGATTLLPDILPFAKATLALVGILLVLTASRTVDRDDEDAIDKGLTSFSAIRSTTAEFYAFLLFSLTGAMLCASAADLVWLFLALELTSLPTYVMVVLSGRGREGFLRSQEAGVKYFFLGALAAATFLYGFALLYGGTGATRFDDIAAHIATHGMGPIALAGMVLSILGISFKIAAVPMHFYTADVYQGAASPVSAFLAFVPKTAGMLSILVLVSLMGWVSPQPDSGPATLPPVIDALLWLIAVITMTVGNVLATLQSSAKRMLAYSSIAHSGYMLAGVIAGPGDGSFTSSGVAAVLFYLLCYGVMNTGAFAVLASLENRAGSEAENLDDLRGLARSHPVLGWSLALCMLSLLGFPPILGFFAKVPLFTSALGGERTMLVVALALNSAIAAFYYLRVVALVLLDEPGPRPLLDARVPSRVLVALICAAGVIVLGLLGNPLMRASARAARVAGPAHAAPISTHDAHAAEAH